MGSTLLRKLATRFLQTPVDELRTTKNHRITSNMRDDQTVQTKVGHSDESNSHHTGIPLSLVGAAVRDGLHNNRPGASSPQSAGLQRPGLLLALTGLNPAARHLSCGKCHFLCKETSLLRSPSLLVHSWIRSTSPRIGSTAASSDGYSARFVLRSRLGHAGRFWHRKWLPARIPAAKKFLESGLTIDVGCPLPLGSCGAKLHPPPSSHSMFRSQSVHALLQQERRYSGGVETSVCRRTWDINCHQESSPGRQQYGRSRRCP